MIETILVPTDGSTCADRAVALAGELARANGAKIVLLHVLSDIIADGVPSHLPELADAEHLRVGDVMVGIGEQVLAGAEKLVRANGAETVVTAMPSGNPAKSIIETAKARSADLIVIGSRGLGTIEELLLGSVSHKVSHLAPCNCLIVR